MLTSFNPVTVKILKENSKNNVNCIIVGKTTPNRGQGPSKSKSITEAFGRFKFKEKQVASKPKNWSWVWITSIIKSLRLNIVCIEANRQLSVNHWYYSSIEGRNHHQYVLSVGTWCKLHPIDNSLVRQEISPTVRGFTVGRILTTSMIVSGRQRSHWQNDHQQEATSPTEWLLAGRDVTIEMIIDKKWMSPNSSPQWREM